MTDKETAETTETTETTQARRGKKSTTKGRTHQAPDATDSPLLHAPRGVRICKECKAEYRHDGDDCGNHED